MFRNFEFLLAKQITEYYESELYYKMTACKGLIVAKIPSSDKHKIGNES